jgi:hypothetical protein
MVKTILQALAKTLKQQVFTKIRYNHKTIKIILAKQHHKFKIQTHTSHSINNP